MLGRKSKQRAPRCWSMPHPRTPRGSSCPPARPRLPRPTWHPAAGLPARAGGTPRHPGPGGRRSWTRRTHRTPRPGVASLASAAGEQGWVRTLGPLAWCSPADPGLRPRGDPPREGPDARAQGRVGLAQPLLTMGTSAGRSSTKLLGKSPLRCRHCPSHQPSTSVRCGQGRRQQRGAAPGCPVPTPRTLLRTRTTSPHRSGSSSGSSAAQSKRALQSCGSCSAWEGQDGARRDAGPSSSQLPLAPRAPRHGKGWVTHPALAAGWVLGTAPPAPALPAGGETRSGTRVPAPSWGRGPAQAAPEPRVPPRPPQHSPPPTFSSAAATGLGICSSAGSQPHPDAGSGLGAHGSSEMPVRGSGCGCHAVG